MRHLHELSPGRGYLIGQTVDTLDQRFREWRAKLGAAYEDKGQEAERPELEGVRHEAAFFARFRRMNSITAATRAVPATDAMAV